MAVVEVPAHHQWGVDEAGESLSLSLNTIGSLSHTHTHTHTLLSNIHILCPLFR